MTQVSILPARVLASRVMPRVAWRTRAFSLPLPMRERLDAGRMWVQLQRLWIRWFQLHDQGQRGASGGTTAADFDRILTVPCTAFYGSIGALLCPMIACHAMGTASVLVTCPDSLAVTILWPARGSYCRLDFADLQALLGLNLAGPYPCSCCTAAAASPLHDDKHHTARAQAARALSAPPVDTNAGQTERHRLSMVTAAVSFAWLTRGATSPPAARRVIFGFTGVIFGRPENPM